MPTPSRERLESLLLDSPALAFDAAGYPAVSYASRSTSGEAELHFARRDDAGWDVETVSWMGAGDFSSNLVIDADGVPHVVLARELQGVPHLMLASRMGATLHRGRVGGLAAGWRAQALPLTSVNDDETAPFPLATSLSGSEQAPQPTADPLVLYRLLHTGDRPAGNDLRTAKAGGAVELAF